MMRVYSEVLLGLPLWAIRQGFAKVKAGEVDGLSLDFPPAAPRLRKVVSDVMQSLLTDRHNISKVLSAREAPAENSEMAEQLRKTIHDGLKQLSADIKAQTYVPPPSPEQSGRKAPTHDEIREIYKTRSLPAFGASR